MFLVLESRLDETSKVRNISRINFSDTNLIHAHLVALVTISISHWTRTNYDRVKIPPRNVSAPLFSWQSVILLIKILLKIDSSSVAPNRWFHLGLTRIVRYGLVNCEAISYAFPKWIPIVSPTHPPRGEREKKRTRPRCNARQRNYAEIKLYEVICFLYCPLKMKLVEWN